MKAYRVETEVTADGVLQLDSLPFRAGEHVEVIILSSPLKASPHPQVVRGKVLEYMAPTEPVADDEWDVLQ